MPLKLRSQLQRFFITQAQPVQRGGAQNTASDAGGAAAQAARQGNIRIDMQPKAPGIQAESLQRMDIGTVDQIVFPRVFLPATGDRKAARHQIKIETGIEIQRQAQAVKARPQVGRGGRHAHAYHEAASFITSSSISPLSITSGWRSG
ncbi:hypothetical protein SDC9_164312 [bioreactor metagenome]|uniref:Uncharacterized protein n=1 Tax=bioreactor metagenome TaxID=1076179 RepID=A0A645FYH7_9ZZZZ